MVTGRPRKYNIDEVITKIREFRVANPTKVLKIPELAAYLKNNGIEIEPYTRKLLDFRN